MKLHLTVSPNARRSEAQWMPDGVLKVRVAAPPTEGKANRELLAFLARSLDVPPSAVRLLKGGESRHKVVEISGISDELARRKLADTMSSSEAGTGQ